MEENLLSDNCPICLEPMASESSDTTDDLQLRTPCDHLFHRWCLLEWFRIGIPGNYCPLCKTPLEGGASGGAVPASTSHQPSLATRLLALRERMLIIRHEFTDSQHLAVAMMNFIVTTRQQASLRARNAEDEADILIGRLEISGAPGGIFPILEETINEYSTSISGLLEISQEILDIASEVLETNPGIAHTLIQEVRSMDVTTNLMRDQQRHLEELQTTLSQLQNEVDRRRSIRINCANAILVLFAVFIALIVKMLG